ncbi:MAG: ABC transporter ATP-binding protein [Nitrospiraceae bacterium]|jgi:ABC-type polysaccharide/polyol phosphate transport system ATPase subunit|nr:ABC transporter ATP-binding protein [Nitrospiraceae bacterium]
MSSEPAVIFTNVWKKYSKNAFFHKSLREDIINIFSHSTDKSELKSDEFWALRNVSFQINKGESVGLYGHNGAGKSTILKLITSITAPTLGTVHVDGRIAPLLEIGAGFHPDLSGMENIFVNGTILGMSISEVRRKVDTIVDFAELREFIGMPVKKYSSGMYLRLAFSIAIHSQADIFLIDEVLSVGDTQFQERCFQCIREMQKAGITIIAVSHNEDLLKSLCHRILYIHKGEITKTSG